MTEPDLGELLDSTVHLRSSGLRVGTVIGVNDGLTVAPDGRMERPRDGGVSLELASGTHGG